MHGLDDYSTEVRRITQCPYTPSLKVCSCRKWHDRGSQYFDYIDAISKVSINEAQLNTAHRDFMISSKVQIQPCYIDGPKPMHARSSPWLLLYWRLLNYGLMLWTFYGCWVNQARPYELDFADFPYG